MTDETPTPEKKPTPAQIAKHYALWAGNLRKMEEILLDVQDNLGALFGTNEQGIINPTKMRQWADMTNKIQSALPGELDHREVIFVSLTLARGAFLQLTDTIIKPLEEADPDTDPDLEIEDESGPRLIQ